MSERLTERVIVVTGGASGIGEGLCRGFAREGASVVVCDINGKQAEIVAQDILEQRGRALAIQADVTDRESVLSLIHI